jgi:hypothetical protein
MLKLFSAIIFKTSTKNYFMGIIIKLSWLLLLAVIVTSCVKEDDEVEYESSRPTIVRLKDAENEITQKARDVLPTIDEFVLLDLRRDATKPSDMSQPLTLKITKDFSLVSAYNTAHGTTFVELPAANYTITEDLSNITFAPGESVKTVKIRVNKAGLDLSTQYALGFKITEVGSGAEISSAYKEAIYAIGIKNKYDGTYSVAGTMVDIAAPTLTAYSPQEIDLVTDGPSRVIGIPRQLGIPGILILSGGSLSYYGSFGLVINFDPVTDAVTSVVNYYGQPAGNTRSAMLDDTGINKYDAATKTMDLKFFMLQPNTVTTPPYIRTSFDQKWTYIGPR